MKLIKSVEELADFIRTRQNKKTLITFHSIGDRDCIGSALPLSKAFSNCKISTPDFITRNSSKLLERLKINSTITSSYPKNSEFIIILDSNRYELLGRFKENLLKENCDMLFIDHHDTPEDKLYYSKGHEYIFNDERYNSTSSIIYEIIKKLKIPLSKEDQMLLLNGIVADSANFQNADKLTFFQVYEILSNLGQTYQEVIDTRKNMNYITRKGVLEDLLKAKITQSGKYLIVSGMAINHANLAAEAALNAGADFAAFYSIHEKEASISARLKSPLDKELKLHLGKLMQPLGKVLGGTGGGHPCAAGAYGSKKAAIKIAFNELITNVSETFSKCNN
ncbi:MAG: DHH family phosphoesterase [Candidatus Micrarchaeia archaeon]